MILIMEELYQPLNGLQLFANFGELAFPTKTYDPRRKTESDRERKRKKKEGEHTVKNTENGWWWHISLKVLLLLLLPVCSGADKTPIVKLKNMKNKKIKPSSHKSENKLKIKK